MFSIQIQYSFINVTFELLYCYHIIAETEPVFVTWYLILFLPLIRMAQSQSFLITNYKLLKRQLGDENVYVGYILFLGVNWVKLSLIYCTNLSNKKKKHPEVWMWSDCWILFSEPLGAPYRSTTWRSDICRLDSYFSLMTLCVSIKSYRHMRCVLAVMFSHNTSTRNTMFQII